MLARWDADVTPSSPDWVVLHGGVNDVIGFSRSTATVTARFDAIIAKAALEGVSLMICTPPSSTAATAPQKVVLGEVRTYLLALSAPNVVVVDTGLSLTTGDGVTADATKLADSVHPNNAGYTAMANVIDGAIAAIP